MASIIVNLSRLSLINARDAFVAEPSPPGAKKVESTVSASEGGRSDAPKRLWLWTCCCTPCVWQTCSCEQEHGPTEGRVVEATTAHDLLRGRVNGWILLDQRGISEELKAAVREWMATAKDLLQKVEVKGLCSCESGSEAGNCQGRATCSGCGEALIVLPCPGCGSEGLVVGHTFDFCSVHTGKVLPPRCQTCGADEKVPVRAGSPLAFDCQQCGAIDPDELAFKAKISGVKILGCTGKEAPKVLAAALAAFERTGTVEAEFGKDTVQGSVVTLAHHGDNSANPCPSLSPNLDLGLQAIGVSHFDADTLIGVMACLGVKPKGHESFYELVAFGDLNGPHKLRTTEAGASQKDLDLLEAFYEWGQSQLRLPLTAEATDVTEYFIRGMEILRSLLSGEIKAAPLAETFRRGRLAVAEETWKLSWPVLGLGLGFASWEARKAEGFGEAVFFRTGEAFMNASYERGGEKALGVIALNAKTGAITLSWFDAAKAELSAASIMQGVFGPNAGGHAGIAGTPRGEKFSTSDVHRIIEAINDRLWLLRLQEQERIAFAGGEASVDLLKGMRAMRVLEELYRYEADYGPLGEERLAQKAAARAALEKANLG